MEEGTPLPASHPPLPGSPASNGKAMPSTADHAYPPFLTYIVQVPKDQIYRIPPKENAHFVEQYHAHLASRKKQRSPCLNFVLRFLCIFLSIALPLVLVALIFYIIVRPAAPIFNIDRVVMSPNAQYEAFMEVTNPSAGMGYAIEKGNGLAARLDYKGKILADGQWPQLNLKARESRRFNLLLHGMEKALLGEVEENLQGGKKVVPIRLMVATLVKVEIWGLRLWRMKMKMECDVRVKDTGKMTKVLSQECNVVIELVRS